MTLPDDIANAVAPLFDQLPLDTAMTQLVVTTGATTDQLALVEGIVTSPAIRGRDALAAGLWLYADELDRSHVISQQIGDATGSFWHGIMHRREGDFSNSHYWFNRTGEHPAMARMPGYDGHAFIDEVAARHRDTPEELIRRQRDEWQALFAWCAEQG